MSIIHVEFPRRSPIEVPVVRLFPSTATLGAVAAFDQRHRVRWYMLGATLPPNPRFYQWALSDGREFLAAYSAGMAARAFGVSLLECVA